MRIRTRTLVYVAIGVAAAWVGLAAGAYYVLPDWASRGQFGDLFGAANALFSGLAFAGLIVAILLQREDLELQREELTATREELARTAKAQEHAEFALRAQAEATATSSRLATINFLLDRYVQELAALRGIHMPGHDPRVQRIRELEQREALLLTEVETFYQEVIRITQFSRESERLYEERRC